MVHRAEMLRVNSAFRVNFIVPNKLVTNGGVQGDVVNRIDSQVVSDNAVTTSSQCIGVADDVAFSIGHIVPYELSAYCSVECLVIAWINRQFEIYRAVAICAVTLQMYGVIYDACCFRVQVETIFSIRIAKTDCRSQQGVFGIIDCQDISNSAVAVVDGVEMLSVDSAFCVNLIIPHKSVAYGGAKSVVVCGIDS